MFKKLVLSGVLALVGASSVLAQTDYKKTEFYVGFSHNQVDNGVGRTEAFDVFNDRDSFNGFQASGVYNFSRYVGVKGDVSGTYKKDEFTTTVPVTSTTTATSSFESRRSVYNFLGGVQVKDNSSEARVKPFAHALVGAGHQRINFESTVCGIGNCPSFNGDDSATGLAGAFGGGLDIKLSNRIDLRAFQVDYNPMRLNDTTLHNFRFGIGVVFK